MCKPLQAVLIIESGRELYSKETDIDDDDDVLRSNVGSPFR